MINVTFRNKIWNVFIGLVFWSYHNLRKTNSIISQQKDEIIYLNQNLPIGWRQVRAGLPTDATLVYVQRLRTWMD